MSHRPNVPCAVCGALMWGGRGSLPAGQRTCLACRRARPLASAIQPIVGEGTRKGAKADCPRCGTTFISKHHRGQTFCSPACSGAYLAANWPERPCRHCGKPTRNRHRSCPTCTRERRRAQQHAKDSRRRGAPKAGRIVGVRYLGTRDGWRCHLCRRLVQPRLAYPHPKSPSIDHLVPISDHGTNDPGNLALAHLICNVRRGNRGVVQLALFG